MKVLLGHSRYQQPGGEDAVFDSEAFLLARRGHRVVRFAVHNSDLEVRSLLRVVRDTFWNPETYRALRRILREEGITVAHFHNIFPVLSPSVYYAAKAEGVPVVQTLHNYRYVCPNALFFRDGQVCEECLGHLLPWPGIVHSCYRGSRAATGVVASMLGAHKVLGTWTRMVDVYVALTEFARQKFIEGGLPPEKIVVKPNFVDPDPGMGDGRGGYALFVGRLVVEKGLDTLLAAWKELGGKVPLKVVGDGPLAGWIYEAQRFVPGVEWLGWRPRREVLDLMRQASFLIFPSRCYEGFPVTIAEAFATGLPVIGSRIGAMTSLIDDGRTGLHFRPGDYEDLAAKVELLLTHPSELARMREEARSEYEAKYTAERNYRLLLEVYERAMDAAHRS